MAEIKEKTKGASDMDAPFLNISLLFPESRKYETRPVQEDGFRISSASLLAMHCCYAVP